MKIIKVGDNKTKVKRGMISKFGESIYHTNEVKGVFIKVEFKDGSNIGYQRDEDDDEVEVMMSGDGEAEVDD